MTVSLRRTVSHGWGYDFNYTLSHAIDNGSGSEALSTGGTSGVTNIQNAFAPSEGLGPADYDARHTINANAVIELPIGKGKALFSGVRNWVDEIIGGWQISTLFTFHTGNPITCTSSNQYNTNYDNTAYCILAPGVGAVPASTLQFDQTHVPSLFANTSVGADFVPGYSGMVGNRGILRGLDFWDDDASVI